MRVQLHHVLIQRLLQDLLLQKCILVLLARQVLVIVVNQVAIVEFIAMEKKVI
jgi:hypothetical protein